MRGGTLLDRLRAPRDVASLIVFRVLFGLLGLYASVRFLAFGWVERFYVEPTFYFKYWGFEWVQVLPPWAMHAAFVALAALSLGIALGLFYRACCFGFFVIFTYVELIDVSNYLNHYYLLSLLSLLLLFLPLHAAGSLDARRRPALRRATLPAWMLWLLRVQVGVVYVYAALAKANGDWLLHGQPLNIWLSARADTPLIGPLFEQFWFALVMSWAGFLHDLLIVPLLLWRRTRVWAYSALVGFHVLTGLLFSIGLFPLIMVASATLFLSASWPRRWLGRKQAAPAAPAPRRSGGRGRRWAAALVVVYLAFQVAMPLRGFAYGGNLAWHEQGMRWSWRVLVREKDGAVTYTVRQVGQHRVRTLFPARYLTPHQEREMAGQPDLIVQLGQHIGREYAARLGGPVEVRVDAIASLNGRRATALIDPDVDLMTIRPGLAAADWILPAPQGPPIRLQPLTEWANRAAAGQPR